MAKARCHETIFSETCVAPHDDERRDCQKRNRDQPEKQQILRSSVPQHHSDGGNRQRSDHEAERRLPHEVLDELGFDLLLESARAYVEAWQVVTYSPGARTPWKDNPPFVVVPGVPYHALAGWMSIRGGDEAHLS